MATFLKNNRVELLTDLTYGWDKNTVIFSAGHKGTVVLVKDKVLRVVFDDDTNEHSSKIGRFVRVENIKFIADTPTVSDLISQLAAALGHDIETATEAGILVDALAELERMRKDIDKLRFCANDACAEYGGDGETDAMRRLAHIIGYPGY